MKKINFKFQFNPKIAIFVSTAIFFIYLLYLSIPSLYDTGRVQKDLTNKLLKDFSLNFSLSTDITYRILPQPHFSIKDSKLFYKESNVANDIGEIKELKVFISQHNFFNKEKIYIKKIELNKANFFFKRKDFSFLKSFLNKKFSEKNIKIKKSKFFYNDSSGNVVFIYTTNQTNIFKSDEDVQNLFESNGEIFNIPTNIFWSKDLETKNESLKINTKKVFFNLINKSIFNGDRLEHENILNIASGRFKTKYEIKEKNIKIKSEKSSIKNIPISYEGKINFKPFSFSLNINSKEINFLYLLKNSFILNEIILSNALNQKSLNGRINIKSDKLTKNKIFEKLNLNINFDEGKINLNNSQFISNKIGKMELFNSYFLEKDKKIFFEGTLRFKVNKTKEFYKILLVPKKKRKDFEKIDFNFSYDLTDKYANINNIIFYSKKGKKINSEKIDDIVENNIDNQYNILNFNSLKNFLKKIFYIYSEEG